MPTLTAYENRIAAYAAEHHHSVSRGQVKRIARDLYERQTRMSDVDLERVFMVADPTPPAAFREITRNDRAAARRLGLAVAS